MDVALYLYRFRVTVALVIGNTRQRLAGILPPGATECHIATTVYPHNLHNRSACAVADCFVPAAAMAREHGVAVCGLLPHLANDNSGSVLCYTIRLGNTRHNDTLRRHSAVSVTCAIAWAFASVSAGRCSWPCWVCSPWSCPWCTCIKSSTVAGALSIESRRNKLVTIVETNNSAPCFNCVYSMLYICFGMIFLLSFRANPHPFI